MRRTWCPPVLSMTSCCFRSLSIRPEGTKDPFQFPRGYVPIKGSEPIEVVYEMVKDGHFVSSDESIQAVHNAYVGVRKLLGGELLLRNFQDVMHFQRRLKELSSRILIPREFWSLRDFNDPELNQSFGVQNVYFDNFKWSQQLWKRFVQYVEKWFPVTEHSHLLYFEYTRLMRSFYSQEEGLRLKPLLPREVVLHPSFEIETPGSAERQPLLLFRVWLENFRKPLSLNKSLALRAGCGAVPLVMKQCGVPMVRMTDPRPSAIEGFHRDTHAMSAKFQGISMQVASLFPTSSRVHDEKHRYDLIVYFPDQNLLQGFEDNSSAFAPGFGGYRGDLETFFEQAGDYLSDRGVIAICTTNFSALAEPSKPHPIEYEVKVNRRWLVLDYYDRPMKHTGKVKVDSIGFHRVPLVEDMRRKLKSELWILHKVESLPQFAHVHKVPGAEAPGNTAAHWRHKGLTTHRRRVMKQQVELMGWDWGEYKERMLKVLQESPSDTEDEVTETIRMALDPTYPSVLAEKARHAVEKNLESQRQFHTNVAKEFDQLSPREVFDSVHLK